MDIEVPVNVEDFEEFLNKKYTPEEVEEILELEEQIRQRLQENLTDETQYRTAVLLA